MSERIEALKRSIERDEQRIQKIQEKVKTNREKLRDLENTEILNSLNSLSAKGYPMKKIIAAIGNRDPAALMDLVHEITVGITDESGTRSASQIVKEDMENE